MKPVVLILAVVAVLAAVATAFLAQRWVAGQQAARPATVQQAPTAQVLVVAREVAAGSPLTADDLRYDSWPVAAAQRFVTRVPGEDAKAAFLGMVPRRPLAEGEPFSPAMVAKAEAGVLAGVLEPGMRAVAVAISPASAVSGFIVPGDRVDVVLAADFQRSDQDVLGKGGPIVRFAAETVLRDVRVLAIDQQMGRARDGAAIQGKTATIAVTPKQAEVMIAAGMLGQLSLVLRPQNEPAPAEAAPPAPFTSDVEASRAMGALAGGGKARSGGGEAGIRVNRAGMVSTRSF